MAKYDALFKILKQFNQNAGMKSPYGPEVSPTGRPYPSYVNEPNAFAEGLTATPDEAIAAGRNRPTTAPPPMPEGGFSEPIRAGDGLLSPYSEKEFIKNYGDIDPEEVQRLRRLYGI